MSYRCERCGDKVANNTSCKKIVTETRPVTYYSMIDNRREIMGTGTEIAKEERVCNKCVDIPISAKTSPAKVVVVKVIVPKIELVEEYDIKESRRKRIAA